MFLLGSMAWHSMARRSIEVVQIPLMRFALYQHSLLGHAGRVRVHYFQVRRDYLGEELWCRNRLGPGAQVCVRARAIATVTRSHVQCLGTAFT